MCDWDSVIGSPSCYPVPNVSNRICSTRRSRKYSLHLLSCGKISREELRGWNDLHELWSWTDYQKLQRVKVLGMWSWRVPTRRRKNSLSPMHSCERFLIFFNEQSHTHRVEIIFFNFSYSLTSWPSPSLLPFLNRASMVDRIALSVTAATTVRSTPRQRTQVQLSVKSVLLVHFPRLVAPSAYLARLGCTLTKWV